MNKDKITITDWKNRTAAITFYDLLHLLKDNFEYEIDVTDIEGTVYGTSFTIDSYDAEISDLYRSIGNTLLGTLNDLYSNDKFNPKAKQ